MKILKVFNVAEAGPNAWQWAPPSLRVVRERKVKGCGCGGEGTLGTIEKSLGTGMNFAHDIPCVCLRAIIDTDNELAIEDELNQHFMANKSEGIFCSCQFCAVRRKVLGENLLTSVN